MMLLLLCHVSSAVKYSIMFYLMTSSGVPNIPDYVIITKIERVIMAYYDSNIKRSEPRQDWVRKLMEDDPQHWERIDQDCIYYQQLLKAETDSFKLRSNLTEGVHINQQILGCEWDDETEKVDGYNQYGYNGEDFLTFDLETETWIAANPQAEITKQKWDENIDDNARWKYFLTNSCPAWLKKYLNHGKSFLQRTELPSVSLLQKSPSSPVSCHATGFYPDRATLIWRKDGEELHEDVDHGEILPNHDGSFQMSVDLKLSSVTPEDWRRYDCVFHLSGVKDDIVTRLDKAVIRTNEEKPTDTTVIIMIGIIAAVVVLALVLIAAIRFVIYKKKNAKPPPYKSETSSSSSDSSTGSQNSTSPLIQEASDSLQRTMNSTP